MSKYIRKEDVEDYCKALMNAEVVQNTDDWGYGKERYNQTEVILEFIENRQPADVVPVVRCKDCKHLDVKTAGWGICKDANGCGRLCGPNDFCSSGVRKE